MSTRIKFPGGTTPKEPLTKIIRPRSLVVVCRVSDEYTAVRVAELKRQFDRHAPPGWTFLCLTDRPVMDYDVALESDWPGWWAKMEVFRVCGPAIFCDIDVILAGPLQALCDLVEGADATTFLAMHRCARPDVFANGMMAWNGDWSWLSASFRPEQDRQQWPNEMMLTAEMLQSSRLSAARGGEPVIKYVQHELPGFMKCYKCEVRKTNIMPPGVSILMFHGAPRPWATGEEWVNQLRE